MKFPPQQFSPPHFSLKNPTKNKSMYDVGTLSSDAYNHQNLSYGATNLVEKDRKPSQKHEYSYRNWYNHHHHHHQEAMKIDHSGANSPPLWRKSSSPSHPLLSHRSLSPNSRAEAIVRGQWELMEMVRNMPESSYELSLKDIVEHHHRVENQAPKTEDKSADKNQSLHQRAMVAVRREESKKIERNLSFENKGLFLNMVFPFSFKSKKKSKFVGNQSGKVSPKPDGLKGGGEREWWKKKFTGSSDSDSSRTSNNSGSTGSGGSSGSTVSGRSDTGSRRRNGFFTGCWLFFRSRRSKSAE